MITKILCAAPQFCVAVGAYQFAGPDAYQLAEAWNGTAWTIVTQTDRPNTGMFNSVDCGSDTGCLAVGFSGWRYGKFGSSFQIGTGGTFSGNSIPLPATFTSYTKVSCPTANACTAIGSAYSSTTSSFASDGAVANPATAQLSGLACWGPSECFATGHVPQSLGFPEAPTFTTQFWDYNYQQVGTPTSFQVAATGYPQPEVSEVGALPPGLTFDGATISGTPTTSGLYPVTFIATNGVGNPVSTPFTFDVYGPPTFTSPSDVRFVPGRPQSFSILTTGWPQTLTLTESGSLPAGITFQDDGDGTATLIGTASPSVAGDYPVTITADTGSWGSSTQSLVLTVLPIGIVTTSLPSATTGSQYSMQLAVVGGNPPFKWKILSGSLPKGIKLNSKTGVISGKTKQVGTLNFTVEVLDAKTKRTKGHPPTQNTATQALSITITP